MNTKAVTFTAKDYCQQHLLPKASLNFCLERIEKLEQFHAEELPGQVRAARERQLEEGPPVNLESLAIPLREIRGSMRGCLSEISEVHVIDGEKKRFREQTMGFGFSDECVIYADWNQAEIVTNLWTNIFSTDQHEITQTLEALRRVGRKFPLIYVDWEWMFVASLDKPDELRESLLSKLFEIGSEIDAAVELMGIASEMRKSEKG